MARDAGWRQSLLDIYFAKKHGIIDELTFDVLRRSYQDAMERNSLFIRLISGSAKDRLYAYSRLYGRSLRSGLARIPYLFPRRVGDLLYYLYDGLKYLTVSLRYDSI